MAYLFDLGFPGHPDSLSVQQARLLTTDNWDQPACEMIRLGLEVGGWRSHMATVTWLYTCTSHRTAPHPITQLDTHMSMNLVTLMMSFV